MIGLGTLNESNRRENSGGWSMVVGGKWRPIWHEMIPVVLGISCWGFTAFTIAIPNIFLGLFIV